MYTIHPEAEEILKEPCFELFKHKEFYCLIQRVMYRGHLCGYVAVPPSHSLYGKDYSDKVVVPDINEVKFNGNYLGLLCANHIEAEANIIDIGMAIDVHYGLTFASDKIQGIVKNVLGDLWWFGFDTAHSGDLGVFQDEIGRQFPHFDDTYKNFEFVRQQTKSLAEQLSNF